MKCWHCGTDLPDPPMGKLSFREACDKCNAALHCCKNCRYYKPGLPNDCVVPGTEWVANREAINFCEDFKLLDKASSIKPGNVKEKFDDLFK